MEAQGKRIYSWSSRLRYFDFIIDEEINRARLGLYHAGLMEELKIPEIGFLYYRVESKYEYRPDLIANRFFGAPELWWIIFEYNDDITHPFKDFYADRLIKIPDPAEVQSKLG